MYLILFLMFFGLVIGYTVIPHLSNDRVIKLVGHVQAAATVALLFAVGLWLGGNGEFWQNLAVIGFSGVLFAVCTIGGSIGVVYAMIRVYNRLQKGGEAE